MLQLILEHPFLIIGGVFLAWLTSVIVRHNVNAYLSTKMFNAPPLETGIFPFIGCAIPFGKIQPVNFIKKCHDKYGNMFTIHAAGKWMTFIMNAEDFPTFFHGDPEHIDFQMATQPFLNRGFTVQDESYFKYHQSALDATRTRLSPLNLTDIATGILGGFQEYFKQHLNQKSNEVYAHELVFDCLFRTSVTHLFGAKSEIHGKMFELFNIFERGFEMACSPIPQPLFQKWLKARKELLGVLGSIFSERKSLGNDLAATIMNCGMDLSSAPSWLLAILWAAEANSLPATVWTVLMLAERPEMAQRVFDEVQTVMDKDGNIPATALSELKYTRGCVMEGIRLHSPGIVVRKVMKPTKIGDYTVPEGHMLCLSPYWTHRNPDYFPNPEKFDPERWLLTTTNKYFIAFGLGKYRCPGQNFAMTEITGFVASLFAQFNVSLRSEISAPAMDGLVGVPHPVHPKLTKIVITPRL